MSHWTGTGKDWGEILAVKKAVAPIIIEHIPTGQSIIFLTYKLKKYSDVLTAGYNKEKAFGRMDELMFYQGTTRKITLSIQLGTYKYMKYNAERPRSSANAATARDNIKALMSFLYPVYVDGSLAKPPLLNVKCANIIATKNGGSPLICVLDSFSNTPLISPDATHEHYPFYGTDDIIPKAYDLTFDFTVLHDETLGFDDAPPAQPTAGSGDSVEEDVPADEAAEIGRAHV